MAKIWDFAEVKKHNTSKSCWVVLHGRVYDVTDFLAHHPGGSSAILQLAGQDATEEFDLVHPAGTLEENLSSFAELGIVDALTIPVQRKGEKSPSVDQLVLPDMTSLLNLDEIEEVAVQSISGRGLAYYSSATDDEVTKRENTDAYRNIFLRARVFVDCTECSLSSRFLDLDFGLPIFISPAAMARLAHPTGEAGIAEACADYGALQIISHNSSVAPEEIVKNGKPGQVFGWQLYVLKDMAKTEALLLRIKKIEKIAFICLTLDAPFPGKREADERFKRAEQKGGNSEPQVWGTNASLTWSKTLSWLRQHTSLPIVLKGIQTYEDALIASTFAPIVKGIIISNHGGRALDTASPPVHVLLEIRKYCPEVLNRVDILVDGGIKRGTDVVKALALGAKAVGIGRAALWGLAAGGPEGVKRTLEILSDETRTAMRLLGVQNTRELCEKHINTRRLDFQVFQCNDTSLLPTSRARL